MSKVAVRIAAAVGATALVACTSGHAPPSNHRSSDTESITREEIINFGALDSAWNDHHTAAPSAGSAAFDPDPSLPVLRGHQVRYTAMYEADGRVVGYNLFFPARTTVNQALGIAARELPTDARILWQTKISTANTTCYQADFVSATLGRVLSDNADGQVAVVLEHQDPGHTTSPLDQSSDLSVITDAVFAVDARRGKDDANGC